MATQQVTQETIVQHIMRDHRKTDTQIAELEMRVRGQGRRLAGSGLPADEAGSCSHTWRPRRSSSTRPSSGGRRGT